MREKTNTALAAVPSDRGQQALAPLRVELDRQRRLRAEQLDELTADAAEAVATGDQQRLQVIRVLRIAAEAGLAEIDAALARLAARAYGRCERCAEAIRWERLEVLPTARLCTPCQSLTESGRLRSGRLRSGRPAPTRSVARGPVTGGA